MKRGISGGERKRTSIAYELITNPSLLLLDEPTSGLDSSSAMRVVKCLREQAHRGVSVLATIHQPSAELLFMFDRIILMSEGHQIYNGPPRKAEKFFNQFGLVLKNNCNPADKLCSIACNPRRNLNQDITILHISEELKKQLSQSFRLDDDQSVKQKLQIQDTCLDRQQEVDETRNVSSIVHFFLLLQRMMTHVYRTPVAGLAVIFMAMFVGLMQAGLYSKVGRDEYTEDQMHNRKVTINFLGLAFMTG